MPKKVQKKVTTVRSHPLHVPILLLLFFCTLVSACQTTRVFSLNTVHGHGALHVIHTNSNRVRQKCLFLNAEGDNNWRHQYFMYVLSDKNEVLEIMKSTHTDEDFCRSQVRAIEKALQLEPQARICVRDELKKSQDLETQNVSFGSLGQHEVTHEGLTFDSICNSKKCVGDNSAWVNTCPGFIKQ